MLTCTQTVYNGVSSLKQKETKGNISPELIAFIVSNEMNVSLLKLQSNIRKRRVVEARQIAMFLIRKHTDETLKQVGRMFGNRHHSSIIYACQTVEDLIETDKEYKKLISKLNRKIYEN